VWLSLSAVPAVWSSSRNIAISHVCRVANHQLNPTRRSLFPRIGCSVVYGAALVDEGWGWCRGHPPQHGLQQRTQFTITTLQVHNSLFTIIQHLQKYKSSLHCHLKRYLAVCMLHFNNCQNDISHNVTKRMALINAYMNLGGHFIILTVDLFCTLFEAGVWSN